MSVQPMPAPGRTAVTPVARERFLEMLQDREQKGIKTYGTSLQTDNGRDPIQDALEEACDLWQYLVQAALERADILEENRALRAEIGGLREALHSDGRPPVSSSFGAYLRDIRIRTGVSQLGVAQRAGLNASTVWRLEAGSRTPARATLVKIARALRLSSREAHDLFEQAGYRIEEREEAAS